MTTQEHDADLSDAEAVLTFWLGSDAESLESCATTWFTSDRDVEIQQRFGDLARRAAAGELDHWAAAPRSCLALIILLDQFSRNLHRGTAAAFAHDAKALKLMTDGMNSGLDRDLSPVERGFFYMPMQHSESIGVQEDSVEIFERLARADAAESLRDFLSSFAHYARVHRDIVRQFGRFPHRNSVLGRTPTAAEEIYLASGGPSFGQGRDAKSD